LTPDMWAAMGPVQRTWRSAMRSCAGRMLFGPPYVAARLWAETVRRLLAGDRQYMREWLIHLPAVTIVLVWVIGVCDIPLWQYVLLYAWPGTSITMLRSFLEHQARAPVGERTAIVESGPVMGLLYLHNNLHALHHLEPATPWHQRPRHYRERRAEILAWNGGYRIAGYGDVIAHYLFRPKEPLIHPLADA
ncbi:MAG: fatty acid desaturase, partial [Dongiaceae bacterium]